MPTARWWKFEEQKTNCGAVTPGTNDIAGMLLMEFALADSNDWFVVPLKLNAGSLATMQGLVVQNSFGERFWIDPSGRGPSDNWHQWRMFTLARNAGTGDIDPSLFLPSISAKLEEGDALEDVHFIRDENANMVWGIEAQAPLITGTPRRGEELAEETVDHDQRFIADAPAPAPAFAARIAYQAMTTLPENWIPLIPVHVQGSNREIQLQRAAMPRTLDRDPQLPVKIRPQTTVLRVELDAGQPYYVHEEEVPRSGTRVQVLFSRARTVDTRALVWLGARDRSWRGFQRSQLRSARQRGRKTGRMRAHASLAPSRSRPVG
jgi:hypothetical protein